MGPYLRLAQKSPWPCSICLWKVGFQSCDSLAVRARAAVHSCQAHEDFITWCETSNGAQRAVLSGVTVKSHVAPEVSCVGPSRPLNFRVFQFNTDCYQAVAYWGPSSFPQLPLFSTSDTSDMSCLQRVPSLVNINPCIVKI